MDSDLWFSRWRRLRLRSMERSVFGFGFRAGVAAAVLGDFDAAQVFDIRAIVELAGMANGGVADDQTNRAAMVDVQGG